MEKDINSETTASSPLERNEERLIEIRSEEVQEIMGYIPHWIIRSGITVIFAVIAIVFIGSWFFKYPDIVPATIVITSDNPPASIQARVTGKIQDLFIEDNQNVENKMVLGILENTSNYNDVLFLKSKLDSLDKFFNKYDTTKYISFNQSYNLGELQNAYSSFLSTYSDYQNFISLDLNAKKINSLNKQIKDLNTYFNSLYRQRTIMVKELELGRKQFKRDSTLHQKDVFSDSDFEKAQSVFLQKQYSLEGARTSLASTKIQITQTEQTIIDIESSDIDQRKKMQVAVKQAYDNLTSSIALWEQNYLLISPIDGRITFTNFWSKNQNVSAGNIVFTVVPEKENNIIGRIILPVNRSGKVKEGQKVNIMLANYPHMEFGMLREEIENLSLVPIYNEDGAFYTAELSFPDTLKTNYGKIIPFEQELQGTAEIITEDKRLIELFIEPLKSLINKNRD